jgi:hypothetical protein
MKTESKVIIGITAYVLFTVIGLIFAKSSPVWNSFYFIREHVFVIGLLLLLSDYVFDTLQLTLIYGLILYKAELIVFNIYLAFLPSEKWQHMSKSYDIAVWLTLSIWIILFACLLIKKKI